MRTITSEQLRTTLANHSLWLADDPQGERADLRRADLRRANLTRATLRDADLRDADLASADLANATLINADLRDADLSDATLTNATLTYTTLTDDRQHSLAYRWDGGALRFLAGCHRFTLEEAIAHWGSPRYPNPKRGQRYARTCQFLHEMNEAGLLLGGKEPT